MKKGEIEMVSNDTRAIALIESITLAELNGVGNEPQIIIDRKELLKIAADVSEATIIFLVDKNRAVMGPILKNICKKFLFRNGNSFVKTLEYDEDIPKRAVCKEDLNMNFLNRLGENFDWSILYKYYLDLETIKLFENYLNLDKVKFSDANVPALRYYYPRLSGSAKLFGGDYLSDVLLDIPKINYDILSVQLYGATDEFIFNYGDNLNIKLISPLLLSTHEDGSKYSDVWIKSRENKFPFLVKKYSDGKSESVTCVVTQRNFKKLAVKVQEMLDSSRYTITFDVNNTWIFSETLLNTNTSLFIDADKIILIFNSIDKFSIEPGDTITIENNVINIKR